MVDLKQWRKSLELTQEQLADRIEEQRATYAAYERGDNEMPPTVQDKIRKLGFSGEFPKPRQTVGPEDLQQLGRDLLARSEAQHQDLKRDIQAVGIALQEILRRLQPPK